MPWSDSHSYVHVAIPKTGSTSMVAALKQLHAKLGGELLLYREPVDKAFRERYRLDEIGDRQPGHAKHLSALQLKYVLGDRFEECSKFSIVRNPWARTVSRYHFHRIDFMPSREERKGRGTKGKFHGLDFETWIERRWKRWQARKRRLRSQLSKLVDLDGRLLVDYVGRLESFQESLNHICDRVGGPRLPMLHRNWTQKRHYSEFYTDRTRGMVREMCAEDIERFDYDYEQA